MIRTARLVTRPARYLAGLVLPHQCVLCRRFADSTGLCGKCWGGLSPIAAPICSHCGLPLGHTLAEPICAACWMDPPPLAMIRGCLHYNDVSRKLILAFKHGDGLQLTPFLTSLMARDFVMMTGDENSLVVPVPLHRQRYFRRRYNQSAELARRLCHITGRGSLATDILVRHRATASQGGLSRRQRHRNLSKAFSIDNAAGRRLAGRPVVLVDDVMTTGATLFAAAKCLSAAGSGPVSALVVARVARPREP